MHRAGIEPEWHAERRWLLSSGGRGIPSVVHAPSAERPVGAHAEPLDEHRPLLANGRS